MEWYAFEAWSLLLVLGVYYTTQLVMKASLSAVRLAVRRVRVLFRL
jgi:hypothetical protein